MPVTHPEELGAELVREIGPFWTKGLPADTQAFDHQVLSDEDYVKQSELILRERIALFDSMWSRFKTGLFLFYVSSTDQDSHMLWRNADATHPMHHRCDLRFSGYLDHLYEEMDRLVGKVLPAVDDGALLLVCSDHGFAPFARQFHLNSWLRREGYLTVRPESEKRTESTIADVDWTRTAAYGMGFNGLYLNSRGREGQGIVGADEAPALARRLARELEALTDPEGEGRPVARVYRRDDLYRGDLTPLMPDLLVGYAPGYRCSSSSVLGSTGPEIVEWNPWPWSGDHSMAYERVPGTLLSSRSLRKQTPTILDLPVTILEWFGIEPPADMVGSSIFRA
jgi:predicted AlkP superfamily phosphohydrolase/phosphomutase